MESTQAPSNEHHRYTRRVKIGESQVRRTQIAKRTATAASRRWYSAARMCGRGFSSRCRHGSRRRCTIDEILSPSRGREGYALLSSVWSYPGSNVATREKHAPRESARRTDGPARVPFFSSLTRFFSIKKRVWCARWNDGTLWITIIGRRSWGDSAKVAGEGKVTTGEHCGTKQDLRHTLLSLNVSAPFSIVYEWN